MRKEPWRTHNWWGGGDETGAKSCQKNKNKKKNQELRFWKMGKRSVKDGAANGVR